MKKFILKKYALLLVVLFFVLQRFLPKAFHESGLSREIHVRLTLFAIASVFVFLISGKRVFSYFGKGTWYCFSRLWIMLVPFAVLTLLVIVSNLLLSQSLVENWQKQTFDYFVLFVSVGLLEEMAFRVLINDGMLKAFGGNRRIFFWIAIVSGLWFGIVHVIGAPFGGPIEIANGILKILSAGLTGTLFLFMFWKKENILGAMLIHCLYDFIPSLTSCLFEKSDSLKVEYVMSGESGKVAAFVYLAQCAWMAYLLFRLYREEVKTIDFEKLRKEYL